MDIKRVEDITEQPDRRNEVIYGRGKKTERQIEDMQMDGDREQQKRIICFGASINGTCQKCMKRMG